MLLLSVSHNFYEGDIKMAKNETKTETPAIDLAEVQKQIAAMLAEAKAEANKIVEAAFVEAKKATASEESEAEAARKAARAAAKARGEEYVEVRLFKDNGKYKDDVYVAVNGENCLIKRGETVKIKRKFAEVLENSDRQDYETSLLIEKEERKFVDETARHI